MESVDKSTFKVFSGTATRYLAEKICTSLDCKLGNISQHHQRCHTLLRVGTSGPQEQTSCQYRSKTGC